MDRKLELLIEITRKHYNRESRDIRERCRGKKKRKLSSGVACFWRHEKVY